ncbi:MFS-type transporter SLC18B1-like [Symsagittifera roscoffensis]|uniref:MFS-type transporter SLC18B1-like n=1 Tax=Symsagittifera roscoffensis TaxID=84072 RepID=UPI00307C5BE4
MSVCYGVSGHERLSNIRKVFVLLLGLSLYVLIGLNDTFWTPFVPSELAKRGVSKTMIGIIVSASDFAGLVTTVYFMFFFANIEKRKFLFCFGEVIVAIGCMLFGQLDKAASGTWFVIMCIITRFAKGSGITLIWCSGAPLLIAMFPKWTGSICSWISLAMAIGIIIGAPFGSWIYSLGGYSLPFWIVGGAQLVFPVLCYIGIPQPNSQDDNESFTPSVRTAMQFLTNGGVICLSIAATFAASSLGFFGVAFSPHLNDAYEITSTEAGNYFLPFTILRAVSAPIIGILVDKGFASIIFTFCGCLLTSLGFFVIFISQQANHFLGSLGMLEFVIAVIGISSTAAFIPLIPLLRKIYPLTEGYTAVMVDNYAAVMYGLCFEVGLIIGEGVVGGIILQHFGFYTACLAITLICALTGSIGIIYLIKKRLLFRVESSQSTYIIQADETVENGSVVVLSNSKIGNVNGARVVF